MTKNIVVIGSGPGGYPAALRAAALGANVTVIEKGEIGGVCLNCGCIPSKSLLDAAHRFDIVKGIAALANEEAVNATPNWEKISARRAAVISKLKMGIMSLFKAKKVNFIRGQAAFTAKNEIEVTTDGVKQKINFDAAIIAAGTHAFLPKLFADNKHHIVDNSTVFGMQKRPDIITIIGGGVIGCEFASLFNSLGTKVNIVEMQPTLVPGEDETSIRVLTTSFTKRGINIMTSKTAVDMTVDGDKKIITLESGEKLESDCVLVAVGREAHLGDLGLDNIGIGWTRKGIEVNPQTLEIVDNIYAVGDVNGLCLLAHAASKQGEVAAANAMGHKEVYNNDLIPKAMYTHPEVASVGLNKTQAEKLGKTVKVNKAFYMANGRALTQEETEGQLQIISDADSGKILGAAIAGANASEMIHIFSVAITAAMTTAQLRDIVFAHPTLSELITEALSK
ncbi:dihydrolipoamide dehydrogenase [Elusimicrobium simillimum]|uniref:dihydrolipoyl dehydrogenase n=1 Tax=Elusimicrobium simillimum TaxID=3143438 RepID=UPI003C6F2CC4